MPHGAPFESFFRVDHIIIHHFPYHPSQTTSSPIVANMHQMFDLSLGQFIKLYKLLQACWLPLHIIGKVPSFIELDTNPKYSMFIETF